jgi:hypothetical protein
MNVTKTPSANMFDKAARELLYARAAEAITTGDSDPDGLAKHRTDDAESCLEDLVASAVGSDVWEWSPTNLKPRAAEGRDYIAVAVPLEVLSLLGDSGRPVIVVPKSAIVKA